MVVRHYLNGTEISEPIGFDNLKMKMKRGDYHGISAEVSEQALEFYGTAAEMIREAYNQDLDTVVTYSVTTDGEEMYSGVLDLSTYEEQRSDYCSVSCKVGEVGVKTIFNNRSEVEVAINGENGIDENVIVAPDTIEAIVFPTPIFYTNRWDCGEIYTYGLSSRHCAIQPIFKTSINEFGTHKLGTKSEYHTIYDDPEDFEPESGSTPYYSDFKNTLPIFATDTGKTYRAEIRLKGQLTVNCINTSTSTGTKKNGSVVIKMKSGEKSKTYSFGAEYTGAFDVSLSLDGCTDELHIYIEMKGPHNEVGTNMWTKTKGYIYIALNADSYYRTTYIDTEGNNEKPVKIDTTPIIAALDCICQKTAGLRVRSDWYKADFANNQYGGGGLRAITTGYKLRNAKDNFVEKDIFISFKNMVKSLSAIDCIGWGFAEENGTTCIRVERWSWFYQTGSPILSITAPKEVKTTINSSLIVSELNIGYKKYTSNEDIAAIDSVHTQFTYSSKLKAIQGEKQALCEFIADPYAIELTRRKANEYDVSDWKYDENIFLFEIWHYWEAGVWLNGIMPAGTDASNLLTGTTMNASLSPRRNVERWKKWLFFANKQSDFVFSSGEGNYQGAYRNSSKSNAAASFFKKLYRPADTDGNVIYEEPNDWNFADVPLISEKQSIAYEQGSLKAETIEFSYPLSVAEYKKVKANPYGLIEVDGVLGWIKEFTYSFVDGTATFKLIPKAD